MQMCESRGGLTNAQSACPTLSSDTWCSEVKGKEALEGQGGGGEKSCVASGCTGGCRQVEKQLGAISGGYKAVEGPSWAGRGGRQG